MSALPVSATTFSYMWTHSAKGAIKHLAKMGYRTFELLLFPPHCWPAQMSYKRRKDFAAFLDDNGLKITSFCYPLMDNNPNAPDKLFRNYTNDRYKEIVDLAAEVKCPVVCTIPGVVTGLIDPPFEWGFEWYVEHLQKVGRHTKAAGVSLAIENVPFALLPRIDQCLDAVKAAGMSNVGINYDICNAVWIKEDPARGIKAIGKKLLKNVHISDTPRKKFLHARLGTGVVDPAPVGKALKAIGYNRHTVIEIIADLQLKTSDPDQDFIVSNAILANHGWRPLAAKAGAKRARAA